MKSYVAVKEQSRVEVFTNDNLDIYLTLDTKEQRRLVVVSPDTGKGFSVRFPKGLVIYYSVADSKLKFQYTGPNKKRTINSTVIYKVNSPEVVLDMYKNHLEKVFDRTTRLFDLNITQSYGSLIYGVNGNRAFIHPRSKENKVDYYDPVLKRSSYLTTKDNPHRVDIELKKSKEMKDKLARYIVTHKQIISSIKRIR